MKVAFQPCSGRASMAHYRNTIEPPVNLADVASLLGSEWVRRLTTLHPDGTAAMWGVVPGPANLSSHAKLQPGDSVLFAGGGRFFAHAIVTATWRNASLARHLWGTENDTPAGRTWELMYSLRDLSNLNIPYVRINEVVGYAPTAVPQGFRLLNEDKSAHLLEFLKPAVADGSVTEAEYREAIDLPDGDLERASLGRTRLEQSYLRQRLFGRRNQAPCDICGRTLPVDLLVAAHIKKRAECSREEKLDADNIVMAACRLGCDELYERGYIAVSDRGTIVATTLAVPTALAEALRQVDGARCRAHTQGNRRYFADHRKAVFRS